jgi:hypothetical protein
VWFWGTQVAIITPVFGLVSSVVLVPDDAPRWMEALVPSLAIGIGLLAFVGLIFLVSLVIAPVKLRDEARVEVRRRWTNWEIGLREAIYEDIRQNPEAGQGMGERLGLMGQGHTTHPPILIDLVRDLKATGEIMQIHGGLRVRDISSQKVEPPASK